MPLKILLLRVLFSLLFGGAGLWMARLALLALRRRADWKRDGVVVEGEIVAFEERADTDPQDRRPLFAPVVAFRPADGQSRRFTSATAVRPNPYSVGQKVPVRYMSMDPSDADLDSVAGGLFAVLALATLAIVFLGVSLLPILLPPPAQR